MRASASRPVSSDSSKTCGLRCNYHGWLFNETGRCVEQPYDDIAAPEARFKDKVRIKSYPVAVSGRTDLGLPWPRACAARSELGAVHLEERFPPDRFCRSSLQLVSMPGKLDRSGPLRMDAHELGRASCAANSAHILPKHLKVDFEEFEYGFVYRRIREGMKESDPLWTIGRVCLWPNALFTGSHFEWRVPMDDENTLSVTWAFERVPKGREPYEQGPIPSWHGPIKDPATGDG